MNLCADGIRLESCEMLSIFGLYKTTKRQTLDDEFFNPHSEGRWRLRPRLKAPTRRVCHVRRVPSAACAELASGFLSSRIDRTFSKHSDILPPFSGHSYPLHPSKLPREPCLSATSNQTSPNLNPQRKNMHHARRERIRKRPPPRNTRYVERATAGHACSSWMCC